MTLTTAVLKIPGDRMSVRVTSRDEKTVHLEGGEDQALRMSFCLPRLMGGDLYAHSQGQITERDGLMLFRIEDGAGLDNHVEIEFADNVVQKVSVVWS